MFKRCHEKENTRVKSTLVTDPISRRNADFSHLQVGSNEGKIMLAKYLLQEDISKIKRTEDRNRFTLYLHRKYGIWISLLVCPEEISMRL